MKTKALKSIRIGTSFLLILLSMGVLEVYSLPTAQAASCTMTPFWRNQDDRDFQDQPTTARTDQAFYAVATFTNCQGRIPSVRVFGGVYGRIIGTVLNLGGKITTQTEQRNVLIHFSEEGVHYFRAFLDNGGMNNESTHIQVSQAAPKR